MEITTIKIVIEQTGPDNYRTSFGFSQPNAQAGVVISALYKLANDLRRKIMIIEASLLKEQFRSIDELIAAKSDGRLEELAKSFKLSDILPEPIHD